MVQKNDATQMSTQVIRQIQQMILTGELSEGDKLPPERELTARFGIGRPALREALKSLEMLGLVERRHGSGNYIVNHVQSSYFEPLSLSFMLNHGTDREIFEMRTCLEIYAAGRAAALAKPTDVLALRNNLKQMIAASTPTAKAAFDRIFHLEIARNSNNMLIYNTMENVSYLMDRFIAKTVQLSYFADDSIENIYQEHAAIIEAINNHDEKLAEQAMRDHLRKIKLAKL